MSFMLQGPSGYSACCNDLPTALTKQALRVCSQSTVCLLKCC